MIMRQLIPCSLSDGIIAIYSLSNFQYFATLSSPALWAGIGPQKALSTNISCTFVENIEFLSQRRKQLIRKRPKIFLNTQYIIFSIHVSIDQRL